MTKHFGQPNPLTLTEKKHILRLNASGLSVASIRRELAALGFRRGDAFIRSFLRSHDLAPNFNTGSPRPRLRQSHDDRPDRPYGCVFCDWSGPHSDYYAHWRVHHRTRAGNGATGASMRTH